MLSLFVCPSQRSIYRCRNVVRARKRVCITRLPRVLCFHIQRRVVSVSGACAAAWWWTADVLLQATGRFVKDSQRLAFDESIDMARWSSVRSIERAGGRGGATSGGARKSLPARLPTHCSVDDDCEGVSRGDVAEGHVADGGGRGGADACTERGDAGGRVLGGSTVAAPTLSGSGGGGGGGGSGSGSGSDGAALAPRRAKAGGRVRAASEGNAACTRYRLMAVVQHMGGVDTGHYLTYRRRPAFVGNMGQMGSARGGWLMASDKTVRPVSLVHVMQAEAFMLLYCRCECSAHRAGSAYAALLRRDDVARAPFGDRGRAVLYP